jgi:prolyl 4-hydroxylase
MINVIENFLTPEECQYYIELIDRDNKPSGVTTQDENRTTTSEYRTSSTCNFPASDQTVSKLKNRIAEIVGLSEEHGEALQGQLYLPGQYFKRHTDFFEAGSYNNHCLSSGNRVKTFMIYLNDVKKAVEPISKS